MGTLRATATGRTVPLEHEHVVGRASACALVFEERYVSVQHAVLRFVGAAWELRDLGSRNGTYLDGVRVAAGTGNRVLRGASIAFGRREQEWILTDDSAPCAMAVPLDGGEAVVAEADLMVLPSAENPLVTIYRSTDGEWLLEQPHALSLVRDRQIVDAGGRLFRFSCESLVNQTSVASASFDVEPNPLALRFEVSRDEEHVSLSVTSSDGTFDLGDRTHNYLLLTLARRRLADAAEGLPETSCGWIYQDEFPADASMAAPQLNLNVFRIRRQFAALKAPNTAGIIERRPGTKQLRVGTGRISIVAI